MNPVDLFLVVVTVYLLGDAIVAADRVKFGHVEEWIRIVWHALLVICAIALLMWKT